MRSKLLFWPLAAAEYLPNSWIVIENVPGLLEANNEALYHRLLDGFYWAGRNITLFELDAKDFGLAASRKRIFLVIPPLGMGIPQCPKPSPSAKCITLRDAIHPECGFVDPDPEFIPLTDTERAVYEGIGPGQDWSATERGREYAKRKFGPQVQPGDHKDFLSRPGWDAPAPCITASAPNVIGARYTMIHPEEARSYTVGELKALAGAPPGYFLAGPVQERLRQVGNCCPPVLAEVVARAILEHEEKVRQDSIAA